MKLKDRYEMDKRAKPEETTVDWWDRHYKDMVDGMLYGSARGGGKTIKIKPFGPPQERVFAPDRVDQLTEAVAELTKIVVALNKRIDDLENSR